MTTANHPPAETATVLSISSHVVCGAVGNALIVPALARLGLTVCALPTVLLSSHPGHGPPVKQPVGPQTFEAILCRIEDQGWLELCTGVLTGYFSTAEQVAAAARTIARLKARPGSVHYLCDPVLGDDHTGLYVPQAVAGAIRDQLMPLADTLTPNRFELSWLTGHGVETATDAIACAPPGPVVALTSLPDGAGRLNALLIKDHTAMALRFARRAHAPHGTGDVFSALMLGHLVLGHSVRAAFARAMNTVQFALDISPGNMLNLPEDMNGDQPGGIDPHPL